MLHMNACARSQTKEKKISKKWGGGEKCEREKTTFAKAISNFFFRVYS